MSNDKKHEKGDKMKEITKEIARKLMMQNVDAGEYEYVDDQVYGMDVFGVVVHICVFREKGKKKLYGFNWSQEVNGSFFPNLRVFELDAEKITKTEYSEMAEGMTRCMCGKVIPKEDHTGERQLNHWLAYMSGVVDKENADELRRVIKVIVEEAEEDERKLREMLDEG